MRMHKYVKRTGVAGNYTYWYQMPDGSIRPGDNKSQKAGQIEHAHRLVGGRDSGHHKLNNNKIAKQVGLTSHHIEALSMSGIKHDFEDEHLKEAAGDSKEERIDSLKKLISERKRVATSDDSGKKKELAKNKADKAKETRKKVTSKKKAKVVESKTLGKSDLVRNNSSQVNFVMASGLNARLVIREKEEANSFIRKSLRELSKSEKIALIRDIIKRRDVETFIK